MNTIIEKIRAEVNRMKVDYLNRSYTFVPKAMQDLLDFLSDLEEEEKPMNEIEEIIEKELERYARENWEFNEVLRKEVPFDVEDCKWCDLVAFARHFAKWQKEQMMKEAVEGRVVDAGIFATYNTPVEYTNSGDKVKIIIVKEN